MGCINSAIKSWPTGGVRGKGRQKCEENQVIKRKGSGTAQGIKKSGKEKIWTYREKPPDTNTKEEVVSSAISSGWKKGVSPGEW